MHKMDNLGNFVRLLRPARRRDQPSSAWKTQEVRESPLSGVRERRLQFRNAPATRQRGLLMHVMFIHPNFPAQFGHIAAHLTTQLGWKCTFVTSIDTTQLQLPFDHINYRVHEGPQPKVFYNPD